MNLKQTHYIHLWVSITAFVLCLTFPGYYQEAIAREKSSFELLLTGWLGVLEGQFFWFANALYIASLITYRKAQVSSLFAFIALIIAASFLLATKVPSGNINGGGYVSLAGFGVGYFLWVLSIGILTIGQLFNINNRKVNLSKLVTIQAIWIISASSLFLYYYKFNEQSVFSFLAKREALFNEKCNSAKHQIYSHLDSSDGILIAVDALNDYHGFKKGNDGRWYKGSPDISTLSILLGESKIRFYERIKFHSNLNEAHEIPLYTTTVLDEGTYVIGKPPNIRKIYKTKLDKSSNKYKSEITFTIVSNKSENLLNLHWAKIKIFNNKTNTLIAQTSYVFNATERRPCAPIRNEKYSPYDFLEEIYLTRKKHL